MLYSVINIAYMSMARNHILCSYMPLLCKKWFIVIGKLLYNQDIPSEQRHACSFPSSGNTGDDCTCHLFQFIFCNFAP